MSLGNGAHKEGGATSAAEPNSVGYPWQPCERQPPTQHRHTAKTVETQILTIYLPWQKGGMGRG